MHAAVRHYYCFLSSKITKYADFSFSVAKQRQYKKKRTLGQQIRQSFRRKKKKTNTEENQATSSVCSNEADPTTTTSEPEISNRADSVDSGVIMRYRGVIITVNYY